MALQIFNSLAQIDLTVIDPAEVAKLSDDAQQKLSVLISAVQSREFAAARVLKAVRALDVATREQIEAAAAHSAANPAPSFNDARLAAISAFNKSH